MLDYSNFAQTAEMVAQMGSANWGTGMGPGMEMMGGMGFMWLMPLFGLSIFGLFIWFVVTLVTRATNSGAVGRSNKSPLDILAERYARGEIDAEEFETRRTALN